MEHIISQNQYAFIPNKNITDGIILAHEHMRGFHTGGSGKMSVKIDLKTAYDKLNRKFILHMLRMMEFLDKWSRLLRN